MIHSISKRAQEWRAFQARMESQGMTPALIVAMGLRIKQA